MKIDITSEPPADIFRDRGKHLWICIALLSLVVCGTLLMGYGIFSDTSQAETLNTVGLTLFIGPALIFVYFSEKLKAYKRLGPDQKKELADLGRKHPEISTFCELVAKDGREPIFGEYEACKDWVEDLRDKLRG
jgi:hypothetical protein